MGASRTYDIDRQTAIQVIMTKLMGCSNDDLSEILYILDKEYGLRNFNVVAEFWDKEDYEDYWYDKIKNASEF